jgi:hypothetical protein
VNDRVHLAVRLEEATGRLHAMQGEHRALQNSATRVQDLVLKRSDEASSLAAVLSLTADLIEGHIDAVATSGIYWGAASADRRLVTLPQAVARVGVTRVRV